jgi:hypothetical protein
MSRTLPFPVVLTKRTGAPVLVSRSRFRWQSWRGSLDALTGQTGTLTRAATGTAVDGIGTTYTAAHSMPRWETRGGDLGLRLAADDLTWPLAFGFESATLLVSFSEAGTRTTTNAGLVYLGNNGISGARLYIDSTGSNYRAVLNNGSASVTATLTGDTPTTGQRCDLLVHIDDDGTNQRIKLTRVILGVDTATAWTATQARAASFAASSFVRANRMGSAGTQGSTWLREIAWESGILTLDEMQSRV